MTPDDFEALGAAMQRDAGPIFDRFMLEHGLIHATNVGRYPRLRAELTRPDGAIAWIEFWMALDADGQYFTRFRDDLPHELSGGLSIERVEPEGLVRYAKVAVAYTDRDYRLAIVTLREDLEQLWSTIAAFATQDAVGSRRTVIKRHH